jgi:predicted nucleic acid-binding protein
MLNDLMTEDGKVPTFFERDLTADGRWRALTYAETVFFVTKTLLEIRTRGWYHWAINEWQHRRNFMKPNVYIETSIISYYTSRLSRDLIIAGHQQITQEWWNRQLPLFNPHISAIVIEEISRGDPSAAQARIKAVAEFSSLAITQDVIDLARSYFDALYLPDKAKLDALHLALGVHHGMEYILSWNFVHIAGAKPRSVIQALNYRMGIATPTICTPEELLEGDY